jgi:hypothetical protein
MTMFQSTTKVRTLVEVQWDSFYFVGAMILRNLQAERKGHFFAHVFPPHSHNYFSFTVLPRGYAVSTGGDITRVALLKNCLWIY